ncbi:MAG: Ldh family oxidoreductase [Gammaproteobacteria bacterium]|nr:Ldh family oxidoreductase [Gammaproteobacteria bacterium]
MTETDHGSSSSSDRVLVEVPVLRDRMSAILRGFEVPDERAQEVVDALLSAEMMGYVEGGLSCFLPCLTRLRHGLIDPAARNTVVADGDALLVLDANNGFGPVAAIDAVRRAADRARGFGCAWVTVRNANHIGSPAYYGRLLARRELLGVCLRNEPPEVPGQSARSLATAAPALGASMLGEAGQLDALLYLGCELGPAQSTRAPPATTPSASSPATCHHAAPGAGVMLDLFTSLISGGMFASQARAPSDLSGPAMVCFTLIACDVYRARDRDEYLAQLDRYVEQLRGASGSESLPLPGEQEAASMSAAEARGLHVPVALMQALDNL